MLYIIIFISIFIIICGLIFYFISGKQNQTNNNSDSDSDDNTNKKIKKKNSNEENSDEENSDEEDENNNLLYLETALDVADLLDSDGKKKKKPQITEEPEKAKKKTQLTEEPDKTKTKAKAKAKTNGKIKNLFKKNPKSSKMIAKLAETKRAIMKLVSRVSNTISKAFRMGKMIAEAAVTQTQNLFKSGQLSTTALKALQAGAKTGTDLARAAGNALQAGRTAMFANPIGALMIAVTIINLAVDAADPAGYNILDKWKEVREQIKSDVQAIIDDLNAESDGEPVIYPSRVGPIDILGLMPAPENVHDPEDPDSTMLHYLIQENINTILDDDKDPDLEKLYNEINKTLDPSDSEYESQIDEIKSNYLDDNYDILLNKVFNKICIDYGGMMTNDTNPVCMFTKDNCIDDPPKLKSVIKLLNPADLSENTPSVPGVCTEIPDLSWNPDPCGPPDQQRPTKPDCSGGTIASLSSYDIGKGWSDKKGQCTAINASIKTMCELNNMYYDVDNDMCLITKEMCLSKAGKPVLQEDGTYDCKIPIGQSLLETFFGKTLSRSLIQTFDMEQYGPCESGDIDNGDNAFVKQCNLVFNPLWFDKYLLKLNTESPLQIAENLAKATAEKIAAEVVVQGLNTVTGAGYLSCAAAMAAQYTCRQKCKSGEKEVLGVCWIDNPKLSDPPCEPGYNFDGVTTCNAKNVFTALTSPPPNQCPDGFKYNGSMCVKRSCDNGDKDTGELTCQEKCKDGFKDNGAGLCVSNKTNPTTIPIRETCDKYYKFDGLTTCWMDPLIADRGTLIPPDQCDPGYSLTGITCWENCGDGEKDKGATCEKCPNGYNNNGATLCYESCDTGYNYDGTLTCNFNPVTVGIGKIPDYYCDDPNTELDGLFCYAKPPDGYKRTKGNISNYELNEKGTLARTSTAVAQKTGSDCDGKPGEAYTANGKCTYIDSCASKSKRTCSQIGKACSCSYKSKRSCAWGICVGGDCMPGTGGDCGSYESCIGGDCIPGIKSGNAPLRCPNGFSLESSGCYSNCPDGYYSTGIGTCQNRKPLTKTIDPNSTKPARPRCDDGYELVSGMCYRTCPEGTTRVPGAPTQCQGPRGLSYITKTATPTIHSKKSKAAGCKDNRELIDSGCYVKCDQKFDQCYINNPAAVTGCMPKKGNSYMPAIKGCPEGYAFDGVASCNNTYVPKSYGKKMIKPECTGNRDSINGLCYNKCPTITGSDGKQIQLKHQDGVPTQCIPPRGQTYPAIVLSYVPKTYGKPRAAAYSSK